MAVKVKAREGEDFESLMRRFRRAVNDANVLGECKKREFYMSPAQARREKAKENAAKQAKQNRAFRRTNDNPRKMNEDFSLVTFMGNKGR